MIRVFYTSIIALFFAISLSGCSRLALPAASKSGLIFSQERTTGEAIDDFTIWSQIKHLYLQKDVNELLANVSVEVLERRVHLTGSVKNPQTQINAVRLAWQPEGVAEVINEIQVTESRSLKQIAIDRWIKTQLKTKLLFTEEIRSINYSIEVVNGIVYLIGIAQNQSELDLVSNIASKLKYVKRVISHVRLKAMDKV